MSNKSIINKKGRSSRKNKNRNSRNSRKNKSAQRIYSGGSKKYIITIDLNLENPDSNTILDPSILSPEYITLLESHLTELVPSAFILDLKGEFNNEYSFRYNKSDCYITYTIFINYTGEDEDDVTIDKLGELISYIREVDAPFTSEDEIPYFITTDFNSTITLLKI